VAPGADRGAGDGPRLGPDPDRDEDRLVRQAQAGDFAAFGALVHRHRHSAARVATVVLGSPESADDVFQEATERAWRAIGRFEAGRAFRPWLLRIIANAARNERRSRGRRAHLSLRAERAAEHDRERSPEDVVVTELERQRVVDALNRLGRDDRLTISLRFFEQLSEQEMAEVLDCAPGTVKSRLSRAKARLRAELARDDEEEGVRHG
jgi:RNA polymerase sigma factor (sigma-70 family)